ncbi:Sulfurtransferase TusE [Buchnera aphidicola (Thelaxes suberi)]|uniref:TusE/DsrC/DsvC family sulfur relay protein n=1 Tax=Buchnera aphidicola TaxID=9 RepID=UPI0034641E08
MNRYFYKTNEKDEFGYLKNYKKWNKSIAIEIAKEELIILTSHHWEIIYLIREFYIEFNISPSFRMLYQFVKKRKKIKINSLFLFKLFPKGIEIQATKIAGIPKNHRCI